MYQSKLTVKPKKSIDISIEDIDEYFKEQRYKSIKLPKPKQYDLSGETLAKMQGAFDNNVNVNINVPVIGGDDCLED